LTAKLTASGRATLTGLGRYGKPLKEFSARMREGFSGLESVSVFQYVTAGSSILQAAPAKLLGGEFESSRPDQLSKNSLPLKSTYRRRVSKTAFGV
jgi:hypothetical protein